MTYHNAKDAVLTAEQILAARNKCSNSATEHVQVLVASKESVYLLVFDGEREFIEKWIILDEPVRIDSYIREMDLD